MNVIRSDEDIEGIKDPALKALITSRVEEIAEYVDHFSELVYFIVPSEGDGVADLEVALRRPMPPYPPDYFGDHGAYAELLYVLCDDGSGVSIFIPRAMHEVPWVAERLRAYRTSGAAM